MFLLPSECKSQLRLILTLPESPLFLIWAVEIPGEDVSGRLRRHRQRVRVKIGRQRGQLLRPRFPGQGIGSAGPAPASSWFLWNNLTFKGSCRGRGSSVCKASWIKVPQKRCNKTDASSIPGRGIGGRKNPSAPSLRQTWKEVRGLGKVDGKNSRVVSGTADGLTANINEEMGSSHLQSFFLF